VVVLESEEFSTGEKMELNTMMWIVSIVAVIGLFALMSIASTMARIELELRRLESINRQLEDMNRHLSGIRFDEGRGNDLGVEI
jgi:type II secretory pathway component PulJ